MPNRMLDVLLNPRDNIITYRALYVDARDERSMLRLPEMSKPARGSNTHSQPAAKARDGAEMSAAFMTLKAALAIAV